MEGLRVLSLLLLVYYSNGLQSPPACSSEGVECQYDENNLIASVSNVHSEEKCRQICDDHQECDFITFFNGSANPFSNVCLMFNTCDSTIECNNCITQTMECYRTCGLNVVGHMDKNIIDMIPNITSGVDCKKLCLESDNCNFYTYYSKEDNQYHELCILLTELLPPVEPSDSASSGPANCTSSECFFDVKGDRLESLMVNGTSVEVNLTAIVFGSCNLTILAVGGGGQGQRGGGGSGYLQYQKISLSTAGLTTLIAETGNGTQASSVTYNGTSIVAKPGHAGNGSITGGGGYSGGGQGGNFNGGSDGSAGEGSHGGSGTGEDIRKYVFTTWTLTPGAGGSGAPYPGCGGGGGGVMVNGAGPDTDQPFPGKGKGYGGGGSGIPALPFNIGLQGIILLEIA